MDHNSPLKVVPENVKKAFEPILADLCELRKSLPKDMSDAQVAYRFEEKYGQRIADEIARELNLHDLECLVISVVLVKERLQNTERDG